MHRAHAARSRGFDSLPSLDPDPGRCDRYQYSSVMRSKIKIRTPSCNKAQLPALALWRDEVRILVDFRSHE
jgi:hypothetical protein